MNMPISNRIQNKCQLTKLSKLCCVETTTSYKGLLSNTHFDIHAVMAKNDRFSSAAFNSCSSEVSPVDEEATAAIIPVHQYGSVADHEEHAAALDSKSAGWFRSAGSDLFRHLTMFTGLALATYVGVSARIGLTDFSKWDGITHFPSFWAQVVGTFIIGAAVEQKGNLQGSFAFLYTMVTTGICGSMTTFSSWNVEASKVLLQLNDTSLEPVDHSINGGRIVGFLTVLLLGVGMPVSVFVLGKHISSLLPIGQQSQNNGFLATFHRKRPWLFPLINIFIYVLVTSIIIAVFLYTKHYSFLFSLLFGGPGTYLRWRLSALDKTNFKYAGSFPIGTFLANIIGSFILAGVFVTISYGSSTVTTIGSISLAMLNGVATGFCGSLTTVSTFVLQICSLTFHVSLFYVLISIVVSQMIINTVFFSYQTM